MIKIAAQDFKQILDPTKLSGSDQNTRIRIRPEYQDPDLIPIKISGSEQNTRILPKHPDSTKIPGSYQNTRILLKHLDPAHQQKDTRIRIRNSAGKALMLVQERRQESDFHPMAAGPKSLVLLPLPLYMILHILSLNGGRLYFRVYVVLYVQEVLNHFIQKLTI